MYLVLCLITQHEMHSVFDQVLEALGGHGGGGGPLGEEPGSIGGVGRGLLGLLSSAEAGASQPEGHSMQHWGPGASVVQTSRVDGLWCVEGPACSPTQQPRQRPGGDPLEHETETPKFRSGRSLLVQLAFVV